MRAVRVPGDGETCRAGRTTYDVYLRRRLVKSFSLSHRRVIRNFSVALSWAVLSWLPLLAPAGEPPTVLPARTLTFYHTHTAEQLTVTYFRDGNYVPEALSSVNHFLRDFRTGDEVEIDPALLDILHELRIATGGAGTYEVISAYRSKKTNEMLRGASGGVAEKSQHLLGKAIDVRLTGVPLETLHAEALVLERGGVGFYANSDFVHVDTGRVRRW